MPSAVKRRGGRAAPAWPDVQNMTGPQGILRFASWARCLMLRNLKQMEGYAVGATDGVIGRVCDFYFDDEAWVTRHLIVDTEETPRRPRVLISPIAVNEPDWLQKTFPLCLTQQQVKGSPDIDTDKPVSRQLEMGYLGYCGYCGY